MANLALSLEALRELRQAEHRLWMNELGAAGAATAAGDQESAGVHLAAAQAAGRRYYDLAAQMHAAIWSARRG